MLHDDFISNGVFLRVPTAALMRQEVQVKTAIVGLCICLLLANFLEANILTYIACNDILFSFQVLQRYTSYSLYGYILGNRLSLAIEMVCARTENTLLHPY